MEYASYSALYLAYSRGSLLVGATEGGKLSSIPCSRLVGRCYLFHLGKEASVVSLEMGACSQAGEQGLRQLQ